MHADCEKKTYNKTNTSGQLSSMGIVPCLRLQCLTSSYLNTPTVVILDIIFVDLYRILFRRRFHLPGPRLRKHYRRLPSSFSKSRQILMATSRIVFYRFSIADFVRPLTRFIAVYPHTLLDQIPIEKKVKRVRVRSRCRRKLALSSSSD